MYDCCACGGAEGGQPCTFCRFDGLWDDRSLSNAEKVGVFHRAFGVAEPCIPLIPDEKTLALRAKLIFEEYLEVMDEFRKIESGFGNLAELAKELADLLVVTYGTARAFGIDIDAVFDAVHRSNMSKLGENGKPVRREDGKVLKGPKYKPADDEVAEMIRLQGAA